MHSWIAILIAWSPCGRTSKGDVLSAVMVEGEGPQVQVSEVVEVRDAAIVGPVLGRIARVGDVAVWITRRPNSGR